MELRICGTEYALDLDLENFKVLNESDRLRWNGPTLEENDLPEGVHSLEFNAHFGPSVYFTVDTEDDNEQTHAAVRAMIEQKLREMREHMETEGIV